MIREQAIQVLCAALHAGHWKSCAHLAQAVREACDEYDVQHELRAEIESELGISLERQSPEQESRLIQEGLLPEPPANVCEHCYQSAPDAKRFCSESCRLCEVEPCDETRECAGVCLTENKV